MDSSTILRKTAKGLEEMATRAYRLPQRSRAVLIVVDGKLTFGQVLERTITSIDAARLLDELLARGFIEQAAPPNEPATSPSSALGPVVDLTTRKRIAVNALIAALGPNADALAMRIEKCREPDELREVLARCRETVKQSFGKPAADKFVEQCGELFG